MKVFIILVFLISRYSNVSSFHHQWFLYMNAQYQMKMWSSEMITYSLFRAFSKHFNRILISKIAFCSTLMYRNELRSVSKWGLDWCTLWQKIRKRLKFHMLLKKQDSFDFFVCFMVGPIWHDSKLSMVKMKRLSSGFTIKDCHSSSDHKFMLSIRYGICGHDRQALSPKTI